MLVIAVMGVDDNDTRKAMAQIRDQEFDQITYADLGAIKTEECTYYGIHDVDKMMGACFDQIIFTDTTLTQAIKGEHTAEKLFTRLSHSYVPQGFIIQYMEV